MVWWGFCIEWCAQELNFLPKRFNTKDSTPNLQLYSTYITGTVELKVGLLFCVPKASKKCYVSQKTY